MSKKENSVSFCEFLLTVNVLPLNFFLLCNQKTKIGSCGQITSFLYILNIADKPQKFPPQVFYHIQYVYTIHLLLCVSK